MTREIKFRARNAKLPRCWIYGYFMISRGGTYYIVNNDGKYMVNVGTECQYIGIKDTKGTPIYEGDIIKFSEYSEYNYECVEDMVEWLQDYSIGEEECGQYDEIYAIGKKFENPELLQDVE